MEKKSTILRNLIESGEFFFIIYVGTAHQAQLAEKAGLTPVGLSKAKHRGDICASMLEKLAQQLDLELVLAPRRSKQKATEAIKSGSFFHTGASEDEN